MIDIESIADLELLRESVDPECKLAAGRDGQGALSEDFWPTYSAFANTEGGVVVLGVREKQQQFLLEDIANVAKVRKELFDGLNNRQKVSAKPEELFGAGSEQFDGRSAHLELTVYAWK